MAGTVAALAEVLDLDGIPWWETSTPNVSVQPAIGIVLRSTLTYRQQVDAISDPARRARKLEELQAFVADPDAHEEISWTVTLPHQSSTFFSQMSMADWLAWEASKLPADMVPVRLDAHSQIVRDLRTKDRDATIRQALADGVSVKDVVQMSGLSRPRIYQIRDEG